MTTYATDRDEPRSMRELEERTRRAWNVYRDALLDLEPGEYEDVERRSWERLQRRLCQLEEERAHLTQPPRRRSGEPH